MSIDSLDSGLSIDVWGVSGSWISQGMSASDFLCFENFFAWIFLGFRPVDFVFGWPDSPGSEVSNDSRARFVALEL
jgi:hypothetical protein